MMILQRGKKKKKNERRMWDLKWTTNMGHHTKYMGHYIKLFVAQLDFTDVFNIDIQDLNPSISHQSIYIYIYIYRPHVGKYEVLPSG